VFNPAWVIQTDVRFSNSNCGACFTMMALFGAGPICFGSIAQHGKSEFVFFLGAQGWSGNCGEMATICAAKC
jgi:hypothetical protein